MESIETRTRRKPLIDRQKNDQHIYHQIFQELLRQNLQRLVQPFFEGYRNEIPLVLREQFSNRLVAFSAVCFQVMAWMFVKYWRVLDPFRLLRPVDTTCSITGQPLVSNFGRPFPIEALNIDGPTVPHLSPPLRDGMSWWIIREY